MGYATKRETVLLFFWKNQILSRLELGHVDLSEQANVLLVLKDWPWRDGGFQHPCEQCLQPDLAPQHVCWVAFPERRETVLTFRAVCLGLHAEKGKERGPSSKTSRLHVSFDLDGHFFLCIYWVLWHCRLYELMPKKGSSSMSFVSPPHHVTRVEEQWEGERVLVMWMPCACSFNMSPSDCFCVFWFYVSFLIPQK